MSYRKKTFSKKAIILTAVAALLFLTAIVSTVAYIVTNTLPVENKFTPGDVQCKVVETFDGSVKTNVKLQNTGSIDAYLRASVVITWQNADGNVYGKAPVAGTDYTIAQTAEANGWTQQGGYWYYGSKVAPNALTGNLIDSVTPDADRAPEGYFLSVEILGQAIQAEPANAVSDAWGFTPSGN